MTKSEYREYAKKYPEECLEQISKVIFKLEDKEQEPNYTGEAIAEMANTNSETISRLKHKHVDYVRPKTIDNMFSLCNSLHINWREWLVPEVWKKRIKNDHVDKKINDELHNSELLRKKIHYWQDEVLEDYPSINEISDTYIFLSEHDPLMKKMIQEMEQAQPEEKKRSFHSLLDMISYWIPLQQQLFYFFVEYFPNVVEAISSIYVNGIETDPQDLDIVLKKAHQKGLDLAVPMILYFNEYADPKLFIQKFNIKEKSCADDVESPRQEKKGD